jgi:hypothetical protein
MCQKGGEWYGYTKSWHTWRAHIHLGECICLGGVAFEIASEAAFASCAEPLPLLEGLAQIGVFELLCFLLLILLELF